MLPTVCTSNRLEQPHRFCQTIRECLGDSLSEALSFSVNPNTMPKISKIFILLLLPFLNGQAKTPREITVLQWNIWQEGSVVAGGFDAIADEVARLKPDFVTFSEVRNYNGTDFSARIVEALRERGETYYSFYSYDTGLISRHPIKEHVTVFPENKDHGSVYKLTTAIGRQTVSVYTAHLDYQDCAYYNVRGYDGNTWKPTAIPGNAEEVVRLSDRSWRNEAMQILLNEARHDEAAGHIVIIGGDFNEPSHLDWTASTAHLYDHHGLVIPWTVSTMLEKAGYHDAYRTLYPDVLRYPGFTYPSQNTGVAIEKLTWAPESDERERIDFIHYKGKNVRVTDAKIFGPDSSICRSKEVPDTLGDPFIKPLGTWPTDHKGLWVKLRY